MYLRVKKQRREQSVFKQTNKKSEMQSLGLFRNPSSLILHTLYLAWRARLFCKYSVLKPNKPDESLNRFHECSIVVSREELFYSQKRVQNNKK